MVKNFFRGGIQNLSSITFNRVFLVIGKKYNPLRFFIGVLFKNYFICLSITYFNKSLPQDGFRSYVAKCFDFG